MEYNTKRAKLTMKEYGRNVQNIVNHILTVDDKEKRTDMAYGVVELMAMLNPQIKQLDDWKHKLWDHLQIIADYQLDVDAPYEMPSREEVEAKPPTLTYPKSRIKYRHYGKNVHSLIDKCLAIEDEEKQKEFAVLIANFMKMVYRNWNRENVSDAVIKGDLKTMSEGKIDLPEELSLYALDTPPGTRPKRTQPSQGGGGGGRRGGGRGRKRGGGRRRRR